MVALGNSLQIDCLQKQWFPSWHGSLEHHKEAESPVGQGWDLNLTPLARYALGTLVCLVLVLFLDEIP